MKTSSLVTSCGFKYSARFLVKIFAKLRNGAFIILIWALLLGLRQKTITHLIEDLFAREDVADGAGKIDWHDWQLMNDEKAHRAIGELGDDSFLSSYPPSSKELNDTHGYNAYLSDHIALNRSLKDLRPDKCGSAKYSAVLANVSVIITFHNEHLSVLLRALHSVSNRSPNKLLSEIILVDDASTFENLGSLLTHYVALHFPKVKLIRLRTHVGFIKARVEGAKAATTNVLVFLPSHTEVYHNWLPPMLDAMIGNDRIVAVPTIDLILNETFEYKRLPHYSGYASRGIFTVKMEHTLLPLFASSRLKPTAPFETPVMAGSVFAINAHFFWELQLYSDGLQPHGGERFELSFKIWQCGGVILETACSRVGYIKRYQPMEALVDPFIHANYKRVAEVWMDQMKKIIYENVPELFLARKGNYEEQLALRSKLRCKSFKWFLQEVAFDFVRYAQMSNITLEFLND